MDPQESQQDVLYAFGIDPGTVNFAYCILGSDGSIPRWGKKYICSGKAPYEEMYDQLGHWVKYIKDCTPPEMHEAPQVEGQMRKRMIAVQSFLYGRFEKAQLISPRKWRRDLGLSQGEYGLNKASSLIVMRDIMEEYSIDLSDDDQAEAFLIAFWKLLQMGFFANGVDPWGLLEKLPKTSKPLLKKKVCRFQESTETSSSTTTASALKPAAVRPPSPAAKTPATRIRRTVPRKGRTTATSASGLAQPGPSSHRSARS